MFEKIKIGKNYVKLAEVSDALSLHIKVSLCGCPWPSVLSLWGYPCPWVLKQCSAVPFRFFFHSAEKVVFVLWNGWCCRNPNLNFRLSFLSGFGSCNVHYPCISVNCFSVNFEVLLTGEWTNLWFVLLDTSFWHIPQNPELLRYSERKQSN